MDDTWAARDLPVLDAAVTLIDEMYVDSRYPDAGDIARRTAMDVREVATALNALEGEFIELQRTGDLEAWGVPAVNGDARRAVGQWPTAETLIERLAAGLGEAAERETDPETKTRLRTVARELGGALKTIAVNVASEYAEHRLSH